MRRTSFAAMDCSIARTLEIVGEWWSMLIIREAFGGVRRFDDFQAGLGIARNILAARLQHLVDHGVMERRQYRENPPRFEYRLTDKGRDFYPVLISMMRWGDRWADGGQGAPYLLVHDGCGNATDALAACAQCGGELRPRETHLEPGPGLRPEERLPGRAAVRAPSSP